MSEVAAQSQASVTISQHPCYNPVTKNIFILNACRISAGFLHQAAKSPYPATCERFRRNAISETTPSPTAATAEGSGTV